MKNTEAESQEINRNNGSMLVVDGRPTRMAYTSLFFQRLGYDVTTAGTAGDGLACLQRAIPGVIVANVDLPDMNGAELLRKVKSMGRVRHVPFLFYTSNRDPMVQKECEDAGSAAYLRHPATLEDLYAAIQRSHNRPRRFVRLDTYIEVTVGDGITPDPYGRMDFITDISERGMFVAMKDLLPYGSRYPFLFHLPTAPGWIIKVEGEVVYSKPTIGGKGQGVGVRFLKIGDHEQELIRDFIRRQLFQEAAPVQA
jgi:CheY-like chemotaxis protein